MPQSQLLASSGVRAGLVCSCLQVDEASSAPTARGQRGRATFRLSSHSLLARGVLVAGLIKRIDEDGRPAVLGTKVDLDADWGFRRDILLQFPRRLGERWPDASLDGVLQFGADDLLRATPPIAALSAPHQGAQRRAAQLDVEFTAEEALTWMSARIPYPPYVPFAVRPVQAIDRPACGIRPVVDKSWPLIFALLAFYTGFAIGSNLSIDQAGRIYLSGCLLRLLERLPRLCIKWNRLLARSWRSAWYSAVWLICGRIFGFSSCDKRIDRSRDLCLGVLLSKTDGW